LYNDLIPSLNEAKNNLRKVYFVDAAHFVWGAFLGNLWCFVRMFLPTTSGRVRYNVLGAIDAVSHKLITVCNNGYINAQSVCELLLKIAEQNIEIPITIVLDNAKYQHCKLVKNFAKELNIELLFLPSYSPHLNIIERLWKWIKKDCLYCKYYDKSVNFQNAINNSLLKVSNPNYKETFDSLLNLKFQSFSKTQFITV
jgi:transposase